MGQGCNKLESPSLVLNYQELFKKIVLTTTKNQEKLKKKFNDKDLKPYVSK